MAFCACDGRCMVQTAARLVDHVIPNVPPCTISTFLIKHAGFKRPDAQTGVITLIQRFGSAANLNASTAEQPQRLLSQIIQRTIKTLTRHGALIEEESMTFLADIESDAALAPLQSATCTYRIGLRPRAGQKY